MQIEAVVLADVPVNVAAAEACGWQAVLHVSTPESIRRMEELLRRPPGGPGR